MSKASKKPTVVLRNHTRLIECEDGSHFVVVETQEDLQKVTNALEHHDEVLLHVGRGGLMRLLPFQAKRFIHFQEGTTIPVKKEGIGLMKFIT